MAAEIWDEEPEPEQNFTKFAKDRYEFLFRK